MKKSFWWATAISLLLAGVIYFSLKGVSVSTSTEFTTVSINLPENDTAFGGLFNITHISDNTPYSIAKQINDSIEDVKKSLALESNLNFASGFEVGFFGVSKFKPRKQLKLLKSFVDSLDQLSNLQSTLKDSAIRPGIQQRIDSLKTGLFDKKEEEMTTSYSISLRNYKIKEHAKFFVQNNTYYLAFVTWDSVNVGSETKELSGRYVRKQIPVMYSEAQKKIYVPVTKRTYTFINILLNVWGFFLLGYSILVILILPVFILIAISRGNAFTSRNIYGLKVITYSFVFFTVLKIFEPFILHSIFNSRIPAELQPMSFPEILNDSLAFLIISLILFVILKAFQKGYKLQQEQDLTV